MTSTIMPSQNRIWQQTAGRSIHGLARKAVFSLLSRLAHGRLILRESGQQWVFGQTDEACSLQAAVTVHRPSFYPTVLLGGSIGAGEAYMNGCWSADDLTAVIRIIVKNEALMENMEKGWARLTAPFQKLHHWLRKDTRRGSRRNIAAHYDLSNDFYRLFLDKTLTYSAGIFETPESTLKEASIAKYDRICRKIDLKPSDHLLEIGTGWGGFAIHAAGRCGCRVTTATISKEQYRLARERIQKAGLSDRVEVVFRDYRDLTGSFDKLVSIEMIEAVGHHYYDEFFRVCSSRLKPHGIMALQAITIRDDRYEEQLKKPDFIKRYIFPGSCIPSQAVINETIERVTDMQTVQTRDITLDYARTLREWRQRFFKNIEKVKQLGFNDRFIRMWEFYLCYCEGSFTERYIGDVQMIFAKPDAAIDNA